MHIGHSRLYKELQETNEGRRFIRHSKIFAVVLSAIALTGIIVFFYA